MTKLSSESEIQTFLSKPRLAILMYHSNGPCPTGVPVWFHWDGTTLQMFAGKSSAKVKHMQRNPNISVLVTNTVGEPENWVAFDGKATLKAFDESSWQQLIDQVAPRYWDLTDETYRTEIEGWRSNPEAFISINLVPTKIRTGS